MTIDFSEEGAAATGKTEQYNPFTFSTLPMRKVLEGAEVSDAARAGLPTEEVVKLRRVFSSPDGQAALGVLRELFKHPAAFYPDPMLMQFFQGQRSVVEYIEETIA